ncbi:MAG: MATE family efflux transporter [Candidatus Nanopelagicales bacterium]
MPKPAVVADGGGSGASPREIVGLAVPAFGALVAQPLFTLVDAAIVGRIDATALAGLGAAAQVFATITGLAVFLAYGTTAAAARQLGAGLREQAIRHGVAGVYLGGGLGVALAIALWLAAPSLIGALGTPADAAPLAVTYLRIVSPALPFALAATAAVGLLRGLGDTATTLWVTGTAVACNAALAWYWVVVVGWGIAGSAWATLLAEVGAGIAYMMVIRMRAARIGAPLRPDLSALGASARGSVPLFLRTLALRAVFLLAVVIAARMGTAELAAYYVTLAIWNTLTLAMDSLAIAGQALVGRQLGAGSAGSAQAVTWQLTRWGLVLGLGLGVGIGLARTLIAVGFGDDPQVRTLIAGALLIVAGTQPLSAAVFVLDGVLLGAGDAIYLAWAQLGALLAFIPAAAGVSWLALGGRDLGFLGPGAAVTALWLALTVFMLARGGLFAVRIRSGGWMKLGA